MSIDTKMYRIRLVDGYEFDAVSKDPLGEWIGRKTVMRVQAFGRDSVFINMETVVLAIEDGRGDGWEVKGLT